MYSRAITDRGNNTIRVRCLIVVSTATMNLKQMVFGNDWLNGRNVDNLTAANKTGLVMAKIFAAASAIIGAVFLDRIRGTGHL